LTIEAEQTSKALTGKQGEVTKTYQKLLDTAANALLLKSIKTLNSMTKSTEIGAFCAFITVFRKEVTAIPCDRHKSSVPNI